MVPPPAHISSICNGKSIERLEQSSDTFVHCGRFAQIDPDSVNASIYCTETISSTTAIHRPVAFTVVASTPRRNKTRKRKNSFATRARAGVHFKIIIYE